MITLVQFDEHLLITYSPSNYSATEEINPLVRWGTSRVSPDPEDHSGWRTPQWCSVRNTRD